MKGKFYSLKIVFAMLLILATGACFGLGMLPKQNKKIYAVSTKTTLAGNEYSALFDGNVIFSVEKVGINSDETKTLDGTGVKTFFGAEEISYTFVDLANGEKSKTVVDNGEFVKLDNIYENQKFIKDRNSSFGQDVIQEAVMVSFGAYVYSNKQVSYADDINAVDVDPENINHAGITYLNITLEKDGKKVQLPDNRNITVSGNNGGLYFDFVYLITQQENDSNEGYYKFTLNYMKDFIEYSKEFEFYMLNNSSYSRVVEVEDVKYTSTPTLGWTEGTEFAKTTEKDGYVRYFIGESGLSDNFTSYPTITYDYTKFKLKYSHTSNQRNTQYEYSFQFANNEAKLICSTNTASSELSKQKTMIDYDVNNNSNLITIMLTEPGTYIAEYEYLYGGYNANNAPDVNIPTQKIKLAIHGMSANYSKYGYEGAKMQYFEIATKAGNNVDLFIPNAYELSENINSFKNEKLGFVYTLTETTEREGSILSTNSVNSLINQQLKNNKSTGSLNDFNYLISVPTGETLRNIKNPDKATDLEKILTKINYAQTNQGSLWLSSNDEYTANSFYFYSSVKFNKDNIFKGEETQVSACEQFTNLTSFNKKGYYLVFVEVKPNGISQKDGEPSPNYWQVFAMQYTSSSVDIILKAEDENGNLVNVNKYTNKDVVVSWKKPGIFDRGIKGYYYSANASYEKDELLKTTKNNFEQVNENNGYYNATLGSGKSYVNNGEFAKFLIRLESEGETATHKTFTIDREGISGIQPYLVREKDSGNASYYSYATDRNNNKIPVINSITDSYVTFEWNRKDSKANTYATYSYTPFVLTNKESATVATVSLNNGATGITTNYELGSTIVGSEFVQPTSPYSVSSESILFNQGIYLIKIWDEAGNFAYYSFIIDRTENHFKLNEEYASNTSKTYGDDVQYSVEDYKTFKINPANAQNESLINLISLAAVNKVEQFENYYVGTNNNTKMLANYFQKVGEEYYFTVKNKSVIAYEGNKIDTSITQLKSTLKFDKEKLDGAGYFKRKLYVISENLSYSIHEHEPETVASYVIVGINKDNSRGLVYYSDAPNFDIPSSFDDTQNMATELDYGSDFIDEYDNPTNGLTKARATSAKHVAFVWNMGTGNFEVEKVTYKYFTLKPNQFNNQDNGKYFFYGSEQEYDLFVSGKFDNGAKQIDDTRAAVYFNGVYETKEGLYVVTRQYKNLGIDLGDDDLVKNYYFIVDRNGIIIPVEGDDYIGSYIQMELMESETEFKDFTAQGTYTGNFSHTEDGIKNQGYNIYLTTTKLPATLSVPTGKYFNGEKSSFGYYAGQLNVSVYFNDVDNQLTETYKGENSVKIYDSKNVDVIGDYYDINIYDYLNNVKNGNISLRDRLTAGRENGNWIFLSGEYIIRLQDNVKADDGSVHTTYIGFKITGTENVGPQIQINTGFSKSDLVKVDVNRSENFKYSATVSQEYLEVVIPKYNENETENAQVDMDYLIVKQYYNNDSTGVSYVNNPYTYKNGLVNIKNENDFVKHNEDGSLSVFLDTKLRVDPNDPSSEIDVDNLTTPLYYTIEVRYKLNNGVGDDEKYKQCYVYHELDCHDIDCEGIKYYEATYTIVIDREAPSANVENLNSTDCLVKDYNTKFETETMMENKFHPTSSQLYFTKQYAKYYQTGKTNKGYIYVYQVPENAGFDITDVDKVYYKQISTSSEKGPVLTDLATYNLTLPMIDVTKYDGCKNAGKFTGYKGLDLTSNHYYEIVEVDKAGNATQYVIHYAPKDAEVNVPVSVKNITETDSTMLDLNFNITDEPINIFEIMANGSTTLSNDCFLKVKLDKIDGTPVKTILTDATTDFEKLTEDLIAEFKPAGYFLTLKTRTKEVTININLIDTTKIEPKTAEVLEHKIGDEYYIKLDAVNKYYEELPLWYFATNIEIKYKDTEGVEHIDSYVGKLNKDNNTVEYFNQATNQQVTEMIKCLENTTYKLSMTDILNNPTSHKFNTSGKQPVEIKFEGDNEKNYYIGLNEDLKTVYYGYTSAQLNYDKTLYSNAVIEIQNVSGKFVLAEDVSVKDDDTTYKTINFAAEYPDKNSSHNGVKKVYRVTLLSDGGNEIHYITIDTRLSSVILRDSSTGEQKKIIDIFNNKYYKDKDINGGNDEGNLTLGWNTVADNGYFNYEYRIYELLNVEGNETYRKDSMGNDGVDLSGENVYAITRNNDSRGIFKFEIKVFGKDGTYLGNRIFAFEIKLESTEPYEVKYKNDQTTLPFENGANSSFKISEMPDEIIDEIEEHFGVLDLNVNNNLYISNEELVVNPIGSLVNIEPATIKETDNYIFKVYKISKLNAYDIFVGTLYVKKIENHSEYLIKNVKIQSQDAVIDVGEETSFTIAGIPSDDILLLADTNETSDVLLQKNTLKLEVYYNNSEETISVEDFSNVYEIEGNGQYTFVFKDLAGNVHKFENGGTSLEVYALREVVVTVNGQVAIDNAYYNDKVELSIFKSSSYVTGSIELIEVTKNGEPYKPAGYNTYLFEDYGTYRVVVGAKYLDVKTKTEYPLTKVLTFTIINVKEARTAIDLTSLSGYEISNIKNAKGEDVTECFLNMVNKNVNINGMLVTYEKVMNNANDLNVSSGKVTFSLTYSVEDGIYPKRIVELSFTLNNEKPTIDCSLESGEKTTKGFNISFNSAIIYEQVGEAYIYINDRRVATIDENSANKQVSIATTFKNSGAGNYYIKLVSSSGIVLESFKVTIKEPLNTWAIIVIIVVVAVVGTVTVTVIVLRRKMRIR